jgi:hypothetical protein
MIAFRTFFRSRDRSLPRLRLPRPARFVVVRGAPEERIEAQYGPDGRQMTRLVVYTRTR